MRISDWSSDVCSSDLNARTSSGFICPTTHDNHNTRLRSGLDNCRLAASLYFELLVARCDDALHILRLLLAKLVLAVGRRFALLRAFIYPTPLFTAPNLTIMRKPKS